MTHCVTTHGVPSSRSVYTQVAPSKVSSVQGLPSSQTGV